MTEKPKLKNLIETYNEDGEGIIIRSRYNNNVAEVGVHKKRVYTQKAALAMLLVEKWGMVAALPEGEDAAGRQMLRLLSPAEVAQRACDTAELTFSEINTRGWFLDSPSYSEAEAALRDAEDAA